MTENEFNKHKLQEERNLRGMHLLMAVDAEFMLTMIIHSIYDNKREELNTLVKKSKTEFKGLHEFDFEEKIEFGWIGLNKYYQSYFNEHKETLNKINLLRDDRNDFAHKKIDFLNRENPDEVTLSEVVNKHKVKQIKVSLQELKTKLLSHFLEVKKVLTILEIFPGITGLIASKNIL